MFSTDMVPLYSLCKGRNRGYCVFPRSLLGVSLVLWGLSMQCCLLWHVCTLLQEIQHCGCFCAKITAHCQLRFRGFPSVPSVKGVKGDIVFFRAFGSGFLLCNEVYRCNVVYYGMYALYCSKFSTVGAFCAKITAHFPLLFRGEFRKSTKSEI